MLDLQKYIGFPKIIVDTVDEKTTSYDLQYLPRGMGHTLGNAFRRIMLAYDMAASVTGMSIRGVTHEYQVLDGIKESVIIIMLHVKKLRFLVEDDEKEFTVSQTFSGVGVYTSDDLKLPAGVEVLNESQPLFEITDPSQKLTIEFRIEKWYGYYSIEFLRNRQKSREESEVDMILIDNDFRVIDTVVYGVEEVIDDVNGATKDKLNITITSQFPKYSPQKFMAFAGEVLSSYAKLFVLDDIYVDRSLLATYSDFELDERVGNEGGSHIESIKSTPIDALPLSERTRNALIKNGILYVEDLEKKKKGELLIMKGVGRKAIDEINVALGNLDKTLAG